MTVKLAYSLKEAARETSLSIASLRRLEAAGAIQFKRVLGRTLVPRSQLAKLVGETHGTPEAQAWS